MLDKIGHINYWQKSAEEDWITVQTLFSEKRFLHSLFFAHLALEKLCKANWVRCNEENVPPKIHNLIKLIKTTDLDLTIIQLSFIEMFNDFQIEGRYPDYLFEVNKICTKERTNELLEKAKLIKICLQEKLQ